MSAPMKLLCHGVLLASLAAVLSGCSQSGPAAAPGATGKASVARPKGAKPGVDPDMVSAVNLGGSSTNLLSMKFKLGAKPQIATPLEVTMQLVPAPDTQIDRAVLSVQAGDGLQLQSDRTAELTNFLPDNPPPQQTVTVVPQQSGLLNLNATVVIEAEGQSVTRTYSIPLIVADSHP
jgi:hypothetical protein